MSGVFYAIGKLVLCGLGAVAVFAAILIYCEGIGLFEYIYRER